VNEQYILGHFKIKTLKKNHHSLSSQCPEQRKEHFFQFFKAKLSGEALHK